ncbi:MAG: GDSL-type esterase/lipase family protein [Flavobacteriales bacterium]
MRTLPLLFLLLTLPAIAQPDPLRTAAYPFLDTSANSIIQRGDSGTTEAWHNKLDRLYFTGEGQLNVVHIGGSHIQADMWSQQARHRMQQTAPGIRAGRGFIFPFTMARTNNPYWYEVKYSGNWAAVRNVTKVDTSTLGLAGISVTTRDSLTHLDVGFRGDQYPGYEFNRIQVLHGKDSSFAVEAWSSDSTVVITRSVDAMEGITTFNYDRYVDSLQLRFVKQDSTQARFTLYGITMESDDPGIFYHAIGVNGASTKSYLRCQRFTDHMALLEPDLVVFSVGINDAHDSEFDPQRFKRNYVELIERVRLAAPDAAILLTTNTDSYFKRRVANRNAFKVREAMLELSSEQGVAVWDMFTVMGGLGSIAQWQAAGLAQKDRIHFKREGYMLLGDLQVAAIMEAYGEHVRRSTRP